MQRLLIIGEACPARSEIASACKGVLETEVADLGFAGISAVNRFLPDVVVVIPPPGSLGLAYLAQFRLADYDGPLVVATPRADLGARSPRPGDSIVYMRPVAAEVAAVVRALLPSPVAGRRLQAA